MMNLANADGGRGNFAHSEALLLEILTLQHTCWQRSGLGLLDIATTLHNLAVVYINCNKLVEAKDILLQVLLRALLYTSIFVR
jgi:hypothetical protein